jgi:zinc/manganese transport system substrate-binding protein
VTLAAVVAVAGCGTSSSTSGASAGAAQGRVIKVIAAENFWGSIAGQLGGDRVKVTSVIDSPDADPHDYEVTAADGRAVAGADLVLLNGVGYDTWGEQLVKANPAPSREVLNVGQLLGLPADGNPHRWYSPGDARRVVDALTTSYKRLNPAAATEFDSLRTRFLNESLAEYDGLIKEIKTKYAGTPVGASESIFALLSPDLGLDLITPPSFLKAISSGTDPTAADKSAIDAQIKGKKIKVYVYNSQNATPDVQAQIELAKAAGIPVTTLTETMVPATGTWQNWQVTQLRALRDALAQATGH